MRPVELFILSTLEHFDHGMNDHHLCEKVCRWAKSERKGKSKTEIQEQQLTLYNEEDVETFINDALNQNLITVTDITENGRNLRLTSEGKLTLALFLSDHFSDSFKAYTARFEEVMKEAKQFPLPRMTIMKFFHSGYTPEEYIAQMKLPSDSISLDFHHHLMYDVAGLPPLRNDDFIFHLAPKLFVPEELIGLKAALTIEGLHELPSLIVSAPYPNKRYYVAGMKKGRMNSAGGFYPIIAPRERFPVYKELILHWTLDHDIRIDHYLEIDFDFSSPYGQFFSSTQEFRRSLGTLKSFSLTTHLNREAYENRSASIEMKDLHKHYEIHESVTLTNFPIHHHHYGAASSYHSRWYEGWAAERYGKAK